jgi:hypothetical protein
MSDSSSGQRTTALRQKRPDKWRVSDTSSPDHKLNLSRAGSLPPGVDLPRTLGIDAAPALLKKGNTSVRPCTWHQITKCLWPGTRDPLAPDYLRAVLPLPAPAFRRRAAGSRRAEANGKG